MMLAGVRRVAALVAAVLAVPAMAEVKTDLAAEAGVTLASNPLLVPGPDVSAVAGQLSVEPGVTITNATGSSLALDGVLTARAYSRRYGTFLFGRARAEAVLRRDERLSVRAAANFQRDLSADILTDAVDAGAEPRSTRNIVQGSLSLAWRPDARLTITPLLRVESARFTNSIALADSDLRGAELRIARRMNARTSIGVAALGNVSEIGATGRFATLTLLGTVDHRFSPVLRAVAEMGVERNRDRVAGRTATRLSGSARLCADGIRTHGCLTAAVASEASSVGALQRRYTLGVAVRHAIGPRLEMSAAADYQRAASGGIGATPTFSAAALRGGIDWRLRRDITLGGEVEYRTRDRRGGGRVDGAFAGISLRWQK